MEGVDRNTQYRDGYSASYIVTLRMEGVDRNQFVLVIIGVIGLGHPPHGGCG